MVLYNLPPNSNAYPQTIDMFTSWSKRQSSSLFI
jgi:hypothetical protein